MNFHLHQPSLFENNPKRIQFPKKLNNYSTDSSFIQAFKNPSDIPWKSVVPDKILIFFAVFFFCNNQPPKQEKKQLSETAGQISFPTNFNKIKVNLVHCRLPIFAPRSIAAFVLTLAVDIVDGNDIGRRWAWLRLGGEATMISIDKTCRWFRYV